MKWGRAIITCATMLSIQITSADTLDITADQNITFADNNYCVTITINHTNSTGFPVNNTRVNFTTNPGTLSADHRYANVHGIATVYTRSWDLGNVTITAQAPNATNATGNVAFVRGPISMSILSSNNSTGTVNIAYLVTTTVYDASAWEFEDDPSKCRVMPNVTLNYTITPPQSNEKNSPITYNNANIAPSMNTTNESGISTAVTLIDKRAESNLIKTRLFINHQNMYVEHLSMIHK